MKIFLSICFVFTFLLTSCQPYVWSPPYASFEEAIEDMVFEYGEPESIDEWKWYEDGTVRNIKVVWNLETPEFAYTNEYGNDYYFTKIYGETWNQPYSDRYSYYLYDQYGWEVYRTWKGGTQIIR